MIRTIITTLLFLLHLAVAAQAANCPELPDKYEWKTARDYKRDEELVLKTLNWLNSTPLNEQIIQRSKANLFVMEWICGSPTLNIRVETSELPFYEEFPDLLFPYIHGIAQCKLKKKSACDEQKAVISGFNSVGFMILSDESLNKAPTLKQLIKAYKKGKLANYIDSLKKN
jgi:hypothetical protein